MTGPAAYSGDPKSSGLAASGSGASRAATRASSAATRSQCRGLRLGRLLAGAGVGGEFLDRLQFLPPHQIEPLDQVVEAGAEHRLGLLAQPGEGGDRAAGHTGKVIEESGADRSWLRFLPVDTKAGFRRRRSPTRI